MSEAEKDLGNVSIEGETHNNAEVEKGKRPWTPNRERTVRSKRTLDAAKMANLKQSAQTVYKGELDPRGLPPKDERKPRSISRSEEKVRKKARNLAKNDPVVAEMNKQAQLKDFRGLFSHCRATPARLGALYATNQVRRRNAYAQEVIESTIDQSHLSPEDRAFATLLTLGVVSTQGALDEVINRCIDKPSDIKNDVRDAIRISCYEIIYLRKAPHAALDQGVELVRAVAPSAAGLANAILHRVLRQSELFPYGDPKKDVEALALLYGFPVWLAKLLITDLGAQSAIAFMKASNEPAPLYLAVNAIKADELEVIDTFAGLGVMIDPASAGGVEVPGCFRISDSKALLDGRVRHLFEQGKIFVSDAAAQAVAYCAIAEDFPESLLEVGSGRGTKTLLLQSDSYREYGQQIQLTPLDLHEYKGNILQERCKDYGVDIRDVVIGNATRMNSVVGGKLYDMIFVDAPCSGLGTLRRHHENRWKISQEQIEELASTNLAILKSAANHVKVGGSIVYSTCTVTYIENIGTVKAFLASEEGACFRLAPIQGKSCFSSKLTSGSPDAHFAAKFIRID